MKRKFHLQKFSVSSFITKLEYGSEETIKGGSSENNSDKPDKSGVPSVSGVPDEQYHSFGVDCDLGTT